MQVTRGTTYVLRGVLLVGLGLLVLAATPAYALDQMTGYTFHFFNDVDNVQVSSHFGRYDIRLENSLRLNLQMNHEIVVVPAVDAPVGSQEAADAITTASRPIANVEDAYKDFVKIRNEMQGGLRYKAMEAGYYVSEESDYHAQMVWGNANTDLFASNLNLSAGMSYAWDRIEPLDDARAQTVPDNRNTLHFNGVATMILTPTTVFRVGGQVSLVDGLQHNPYRNVYAAGTNVSELHPNRRNRQDFFMRISQYFKNRSSLRLDYKYYTDDWGVASHTAGVKLSQYITDVVIVRYRYRYYSQGSAFFFADEYANLNGIDGFLTGDYRLGDFDAHLFGGKLLWNLYRVVGADFLREVNFVVGYERYFNTTNFTANIFETGLEIAF